MSKKITSLALLGAIALGGVAFAVQNPVNSTPSEIQSVQVCSDPAITPYYNPARGDLYANAPARKSESPDSASVKVNVTFGSEESKINYFLFMPKFDVNALGAVSNASATSYNMTVAKGNYELLIIGEKKLYKGQFAYYRDNINVTSDTTLDVNTADCSILTSHKIYLPNGEELAPDFYCTKTKEVIDTANVRYNAGCYMSMDIAGRFYSHINHFCFNLFNQYYADPTVITNTWQNPWTWTNTKTMPLYFTFDYAFNGDDGNYGVRFDVNSSNFGETMTTNGTQWHSMTLKHKDIICDSIAPGYDPTTTSGNGTGLHWIDGVMINSGTGAQAALPSDTRLRVHMNCAVVNGTNKGADFAIYPGLPVTKYGSAYHGFNPLPVTLGKNGLEFLPIQYLYPSLKIWAGSDASTLFIYDNKNPRLNADSETVWGDGFPFASFYPAVKSSATINPRFDIAMKGVNGEQRACDVATSSFSAYKYNDTTKTWKSIWTGGFDKITQIQTAFKNNGAGVYAAEVVDTAYMLGNHRGRSISRVELTNTQADPNPPTINMINVRSAADRIETNLATTEGATVELYAADLTYNLVKIYGYIMGQVKSAKVECAPYGTNDFKNLTVTAHPERDLNLFWGQNFVADLSEMDRESADKWYDLRITVEDLSGNKAIVHASPAFYADKLASAVAVTPEDKMEISVVDGMITIPGMPEVAINVYDMNGRHMISGRGSVDASNLAPAVYLIKVNDNNVSAAKKIYLK